MKKREKRLVQKIMGKITGCEFCGKTKGLKFISEGKQHLTHEAVDSDGNPESVDTWVTTKSFFMCKKCRDYLVLHLSNKEDFESSKFAAYFKKN